MGRDGVHGAGHTVPCSERSNKDIADIGAGAE